MNVSIITDLNDIKNMTYETMVFFSGDNNNNPGLILREDKDKYWISQNFKQFTLTEKEDVNDKTKTNFK